jgi:hypothetical protein
MAVGSFGIEKESLKELLGEAASGKAQLPEFQRGWVWPDRNIAGLIASISLGYPVGTIMMLRTGGHVKFKERLIEGLKFDSRIKPERLILDGQQRITSLYRALMHQEAVVTQDVRKKPVSGWFYIDIEAALKDDENREDTIKFLPEDKKVRSFRGEIAKDYSNVEEEYKDRFFPLNKVFDSDRWMQDYMKFWGYDESATHIFFNFKNEILNKFITYQIPVIELPSETPKEAVCQVFEKVNTGGITLTVFELLTATFASDDFVLREDWDEKRKKLTDPSHQVVKDFSNTDLLQAISLMATYETRMTFLKSDKDAERAPRIGCKRGDILNITLDDYKKYSNKVMEGLFDASKFLHKHFIFSPKFLPYGAHLIPLSVIFSILGKDAHSHQAQEKISQWYWCGIFGELYGGTTETRFAFDVPEVVNWVRGDSNVPRTVSEAQFMKDRLWTLRSRQSAAYKGLYALLLADGAKDWFSGSTISAITYFDDSIDVHHIFPQDWCKKNGKRRRNYNSILNKTPLSARTNRIIGGKAPSAYIEQLAKKAEVPEKTILASIATHRVDISDLKNDDFESHLDNRAIALLEQIKGVMGKDVGEALGGASDDDYDDMEEDE